MVIIVTGAIGIGKTTVCLKLIEALRSGGYTCSGIFTYKAADKGIIVEDIQSGEKETLASVNNVYHGPHTAKYSFNPKAIDFGIQVIDKGTSSSSILLVDEIGQLELRGEGFVKALELIKSGAVEKSILVIRKELLSAFLAQLDTPLSIYETTINNRDELPQKIYSFLTASSPLFPIQC
ncbi:nucleoside-triphosphatase [Chloroflexota bacterium]